MNVRDRTLDYESIIKRSIYPFNEQNDRETKKNLKSLLDELKNILVFEFKVNLNIATRIVNELDESEITKIFTDHQSAKKRIFDLYKTIYTYQSILEKDSDDYKALGQISLAKSNLRIILISNLKYDRNEANELLENNAYVDIFQKRNFKNLEKNIKKVQQLLVSIKQLKSEERKK